MLQDNSVVKRFKNKPTCKISTYGKGTNSIMFNLTSVWLYWLRRELPQTDGLPHVLLCSENILPRNKQLGVNCDKWERK